MTQEATLTRAKLKTPKAAAIAGILFCVLLLAVFWLLRISVPTDPLEPGDWLRTSADRVALALNLVPFAGLAFLWFIGVLRDRLGNREDRFFATVFLGSGLLFLAMLFVGAAVVGGMLAAYAIDNDQLVNSSTFHFARAVAYNIINIYAAKVAGAFIISMSTLAISTAIAPRWIALVGYVSAFFLLFGGYFIGWVFVLFPLWVLLISVHILLDNLRVSQS
jgi:MFS family permease